MQKEAYFFGVPCVTLRPETELVETVEVGWNVVVGADSDRIVGVIHSFALPTERLALFGDGQAAEHVIGLITRNANCQRHLYQRA